MKVKILEYQRYKGPKVKVQSHSRCKGKWKENPKYEMHKMLINQVIMFPITYKKEYEIELK